MGIFKAYDIRGLYPSELDEQIAYRVGFTDHSYFSRMYLEAFGETPGEGRV